MAGELGSEIGTTISNAVDIVWGYMGDMYDAGVELVQNIIDGVGDMGQQLLDALINLIGDALGGLLDWLGAPASPDNATVSEGLKRGGQQVTQAISPAMAPVPVLMGGESVRNATFNFNNTISGQMDVYAIEAPILRTVKRAMSR